MDSAGLLFSGESLNYIFVLLLYAPVSLITFRWLMPHLSSVSRRIASGFLVAQILVLLLSLEFQPTSDFEEWLWRLDFPSTLASTQLALVGVVALTTAWLAKEHSASQCLYLIGVGLIFPYIGLDDFFDWQLLNNSAIKEPYVLLGAAVVVATIVVAMRSPTHARRWHLCLLIGLSLTAMGGIVVDSFPEYCGHFGIARIYDCLQFRFLEETLELVGNWLTLVAMLGHFSDVAPAPRFRIRLNLYVLPTLTALLFFSHSLLPQIAGPLMDEPATVQSEASTPQKVVISDQQQLDDSQVVLDELAEPAISSTNLSKEQIDSSEFAVSNEKLIFAFLFALFLPVGLICYWRLIPKLAAPYARVASAMLAGQIIVIILSIGIRPTSEFETWLWNLDQEWNIPSTLASTQLALVASIALLTAWLAKAQPALQRLYLGGIGLVFLFLAWDEYFTFHEHIANWERHYAALGTMLVMATAIVAFRSPRYPKIWHLCLLTGLVVSAMGGILLNGLQPICDSLGFLPLYGCLWPYNYEESLEFLGIWLVLVAVLGHFSHTIPNPKPRILLTFYLLPAFWVFLLIHNAFIPKLELRIFAQPATVQFESEVNLHGYRIDNQDGAFAIRLYPSAERGDFIGKGFSVHLVDHVNGDSVASHDRHVSRQVGLLFAPGYTHTYRQFMKIEIPPQTPVNRAYWVTLSLWKNSGGDYARRRVLASDLELLSETQVILGEVVIPAESAAAPTVPLAVFNNGFSLAAVDLPKSASPGDTLSMSFTWRSDVDSQEDHVQFLHLGREESGEWFVYDQQPLGRRLPSRLWYSGLADSETWSVPLPADLAPGRYAVFTGLYRARDQERVPAAAVDGEPWLDARVPLGTLIIE